MPSLRLVQFDHQGIKIRRPLIGRIELIDIEANPLLATGRSQQLTIQGDIPVPVEAKLTEGRIKGRAMTITLGIGQRTVHIKNQGLQH